MEAEPKLAPPQTQNPSSTSPTPQNLPNSHSLPPRPPYSKKRKADKSDSYNANYIKLCNIVKDMRPDFIEVLRTPDFCNSQAAQEIRKKMKHVMDVCKQMEMEATSIETSKKPPESQPLSNQIEENIDVNTHPVEKQAKGQSSVRIPEKSSELNVDMNGYDYVRSGETLIRGSYIVGGSNMGWNFIMYPGDKAVYYGVTKESRRVPKKITLPLA